MAKKLKLLTASALSGLAIILVMAFGNQPGAHASPTGIFASNAGGGTISVSASFSSNLAGGIVVAANPFGVTVGGVTLVSCTVGGSPCVGASGSGSGGSYSMSGSQMAGLTASSVGAPVTVVLSFQVICPLGGSISFTATQGSSLLSNTVYCGGGAPYVNPCVNVYAPGCYNPCLPNVYSTYGTLYGGIYGSGYLSGCPVTTTPCLPGYGYVAATNCGPMTVTVTSVGQVSCGAQVPVTVVVRDIYNNPVPTGTPVTLTTTIGTITGGNTVSGTFTGYLQAPASGQGGRAVITASAYGASGSTNITVLPCAPVPVPQVVPPAPPVPQPVAVVPRVGPPSAGDGGLVGQEEASAFPWQAAVGLVALLVVGLVVRQRIAR